MPRKASEIRAGEPVDFRVEYDSADIDGRAACGIQARIMADGKLACINGTAYYVITRGAPRDIRMELVRVEGNRPAPRRERHGRKPEPG